MDIKEFVVHDRLGTMHFKGELLADKRFGTSNKPRWTDMALYAVSEMSHDSRLRVKVECGGCKPPRTLVIGSKTFDEAPIVCGRCEQPFLPSDDQEDEPIRYALEIIARSRLYHRVGGPCVRRRHLITTVAASRHRPDRWWDLQPCQQRGCQPPPLDEMRDRDRIAEEQQDPHVYLCTDAFGIVTRLYRRNGEISELAANLLKDAATNDPDIAMALSSQRKI